MCLGSISALDLLHRWHDTRPNRGEREQGVAAANDCCQFLTCVLGAIPAGGGEEQAAFTSSDSIRKMDSCRTRGGEGEELSHNYYAFLTCIFVQGWGGY